VYTASNFLLEARMSFGKATFIGSAVLLAAACGGSAFSGGGDGDGGSGSGGSAGSSSQAGKPSTGGTSSSGGSATTGGRPGTGGSVSVAGSVGVAGGPNCAAVDCAYPVCSDGAEPVIKPGECCPTCPPPTSGCEDVTCLPVSECGEGYELGQPVGACCKGCVPKGGQVACAEIACPPDKTCPAGYVRGDLVGGCCYDCVPDPLYCSDVSDCVTADRPRSCCGCPEAISRRMYDADECWSDVDMPRMIPQSCYPQVVCGAVCGACASPGPLLCAGHRCALGMPR
jgi:hypothetical protein